MTPEQKYKLEAILAGLESLANQVIRLDVGEDDLDWQDNIYNDMLYCINALRKELK